MMDVNKQSFIKSFIHLIVWDSWYFSHSQLLCFWQKHLSEEKEYKRSTKTGKKSLKKKERKVLHKRTKNNVNISGVASAFWIFLLLAVDSLICFGCFLPRIPCAIVASLLGAFSSPIGAHMCTQTGLVWFSLLQPNQPRFEDGPELTFWVRVQLHILTSQMKQTS